MRETKNAKSEDDENHDADDRVVISLDPEVALKALLEVDPDAPPAKKPDKGEPERKRSGS